MKRTLLIIALATATILNSCKKDNASGDSQSQYYAVMVMTDLSTNSGLLFTTKEIPTGTIDVSKVTNPVQLGNTRNGALTYNGAIYSGSNSTGESGIQKYTVDKSGTLKATGFIAASQESYGIKFKMISPELGFYSDKGRGNLKIQTFNPTTMQRTGEIDLSVVSKKAGDATIFQEAVGERIIAAKEGKLYIDVQYVKDDVGFGNSVYDAVFVAVIDINTLKYEKLITINGAQELGYYPTNLFLSEVDEKGDLYISTMGNMLGEERNSKILRIKKGTTDFDTNFSININDYVSGTGIKWFHGGGVAINGKIITGVKQSVFAPDYSNFNEENISFSAIDVNTKGETKLTSLPLTNFTTTCTPFYLDSKVLIPYSNALGSGVYTYDGNTAQELFKVTGGVVCGVYKLTSN